MPCKPEERYVSTGQNNVIVSVQDLLYPVVIIGTLTDQSGINFVTSTFPLNLFIACSLLGNHVMSFLRT